MTYIVKFNCTCLDPYIFDLAREYHQSVITVCSRQKGLITQMQVEFDFYRTFEKDKFIEGLEAVKDMTFYDSWLVK